MLKREQKIIRRIQEIENGTFDEDCVKLLLIEIREKLKGESFLKEICHFVAHSDRDMGICHKKVDVRYAKLKLVEENTRRILNDDFIAKNKHKPERFFTDSMLNYIETKKIEEKLFELIILSGINDIENDLFVKYYNLNRKQVKKLIVKSYKKDNGFFITKTTLNQKDFLFLDDILKFIRGTITGKPAFTQNEILNDFRNGLKRLSLELNHKLDLKKINDNTDDLIICVLSLLHDSTFKLFDKTIGSGFLSLHPRENKLEICLMSKAGKYSLPLITTDIDANDYIECDIEELKEFEFKSLLWNNCVRNNEGKLKLIKYEA
jgi:hypothetical protein